MKSRLLLCYSPNFTPSGGAGIRFRSTFLSHDTTLLVNDFWSAFLRITVSSCLSGFQTKWLNQMMECLALRISLLCIVLLHEKKPLHGHSIYCCRMSYIFWNISSFKKQHEWRMLVCFCWFSTNQNKDHFVLLKCLHFIKSTTCTKRRDHIQFHKNCKYMARGDCSISALHPLLDNLLYDSLTNNTLPDLLYILRNKQIKHLILSAASYSQSISQ